MPSIQQTYLLLIVQDDKGRREIPLDRPTYSIGRDPSCDIYLASRFVSRHHATLVQLIDEDSSFSYRIVDGIRRGRRSANGLLINGHKLPAHDLQHEDEIIFGPGVQAIYYQLERDAAMYISPDEIDITLTDNDNDLTGGVAPIPRPWQPTPPPLTDGEAVYPDKI